MDNLFRLLDQATGTRRQLRRGEVLFHENNRSNSFYLVHNGRLRAIRDLDGENPVVIGEVSRGEIIGEMAILSDAPRSASVIAIRDTQLTEYSGEDLAALPKESLFAVMRILASRLRRLMDAERPSALPVCVVVVPVQRGLPIDDYWQVSVDATVGRALRIREAGQLRQRSLRQARPLA